MQTRGGGSVPACVSSLPVTTRRHLGGIVMFPFAFTTHDPVVWSVSTSTAVLQGGPVWSLSSFWQAVLAFSRCILRLALGLLSTVCATCLLSEVSNTIILLYAN
jgi:hypothetical protein